MDKLIGSRKEDSEVPVASNGGSLQSLNGHGGPFEPALAEEDEVHLRAYWRVIRKHIVLVVLVALLGTAPFIYLMGMKADYYKATTRIQVNLESTNEMSAANDQGQSGTFMSADPAYFNTQLQILNSPALLRRIALTLDLEHNPTFLRHMAKGGRMIRKVIRLFYFGKKDDVSQNPLGSDRLTTSFDPSSTEQDLEAAQRLEPIVEDLQRKIKIEPVKEPRLSFKETRLIDISTEHPSPQLAAKISNAVADAFVLSNLEQRRKAGATAESFLSVRVAEVQAQIRRGEAQLIEYAKNHEILSLDPNQNTVVDRLAGLNKQLLDAENDRISAEANYRKALDPASLDALAKEGASEINAAETRLAVLRENRAQLLVEATEKWPEVKEVNQQIAEVEKTIKDLKGKAANTVKTNLETRYQQALGRESSVRAAFEKQRDETLKQNEAAINYKIIQQEIDTNKALLQGILQRAKESDVSLQGAINNVRVIDYAITPDPKEPDGPWRLVWIGLAFTLSLAGGIGLAFFLDYLDNSVRSSDDVLATSHLPTLGTIPAVGKSLRQRFVPLLTAGNGKVRPSPAVLVHSISPPSFTEEYRRLRTAVTLPLNGHSPKTILVTSSLRGEGKTTTAVNIATAMAQTAGAKILIIDADMRRPLIHEILGCENETGLSSLLSGEVPREKALDCIVSHENSRIQLLPGGPVPPNPSELLHSENLRLLLADLEPTFTHIIVDSPAAEEFSDSLILSAAVDGVLFVIHGSKSSRESVRHTLQELRYVGANLLGVVLNGVTQREQEYAYSSYP
ncbi:MAG TPA: polysaccharide biosynthesis tyrosine autokinase [Pyrinomonadaceae bacterium]|nr:polysaccharide biosynthesis tyrosine autokinase [Pyrinomonadaceae bacterium]